MANDVGENVFGNDTADGALLLKIVKILIRTRNENIKPHIVCYLKNSLNNILWLSIVALDCKHEVVLVIHALHPHHSEHHHSGDAIANGLVDKGHWLHHRGGQVCPDLLLDAISCVQQHYLILSDLQLSSEDCKHFYMTELILQNYSTLE